MSGGHSHPDETNATQQPLRTLPTRLLMGGIKNTLMSDGQIGNLTVTGKLKLPGATSALAVGAVPPTAANAGTGLWLDKTGLYSLLSNTYQVKIDATTGALSAGGGNVTLDVNGTKIKADEYTGGLWPGGVIGSSHGVNFIASDGATLGQIGVTSKTTATTSVDGVFQILANQSTNTSLLIGIYSPLVYVNTLKFTYNGVAALAEFSSNLVGGGTITGTQLISNIATGTAPLAVTSTTVCTNLNADLHDGMHLSGTAGSTLNIGTGGTLGTAAYTATGAYEASGAIATHAAVITGVHGLVITAGKTITVTDSATLANTAITLANTKVLTLTDSLTVEGGNAGKLHFDAAATLTIAQNLTLTGASGKTLTLTNSLTAEGGNDGILHFDAAATLTVPATGTAALLGTNNNFSVTQYVGDTSNAQMTLGLTLNQGAADDHILTLKSSDVGHGITDLAEADTYGAFLKAEATSGGLSMVGYKDADGMAGAAIQMIGRLGEAADTTKSTSGVGVCRIIGQVIAAATVGALAANGNILSVASSGTTRFILDGDGDSHQDVGTAWTNFDDKDDVALLHGLSAGVAREGDPVREMFSGFLVENRDVLTKAKLVTFNEDGHHFVNMSKLLMLAVGAIRQQAARIDRVEQRLLTA